MKAEEITLYFTQGSADKVYQAELKRWLGGWAVNFAYGRRGKAMKSGTKTKDPIEYAAAAKIYNKLVAGKMAKGYTPAESGVTYTNNEQAGNKTDFIPQLLNSVPHSDIYDLFHSWGPGVMNLQIKHDGERRGIMLPDPDTVIPTNRRGLITSIQVEVEEALKKLSQELKMNFTLDTEDMGDHLVIFDILCLDNENLRSQAFHVRSTKLHFMHSEILRLGLFELLRIELPIVPASLDVVSKYIGQARKQNEEGVVIRNGTAVYTPGRPNSGGPCLKYKFVEQATCKVLLQNGDRRSVSLAVMRDQEAYIPIGNCTIPANHAIPAPGALVEIEYLYAYPNGGSLYQPQYKGTRPDKTSADEYSSLKFKG